MKRFNKVIAIIMAFSILLTLPVINVSASTINENTNISDDEISMPDLGIDIPHVSMENVRKIDDVADKMTSLAAVCDEIEKMDISRNEKNSLKAIPSNSYHLFESQLQELGALKLTPEQAMMYVYGLDKSEFDKIDFQTIDNTKSNVPGINYPAISGIDFYVYEYTVWFSDTDKEYEMAQCIALPVENVTSKMNRNFDWVDMYNEITAGSLASNLVRFTAGEVSDYLLSNLVGGAWTFAIGAIWNLSGDVFPSSSYVNGASLDLKVTSSSRIVHYWRKINGTYYFRLATCAAVIRESWLLVDNNARQYYKYHEFWAYSQYHTSGGDERAVAINNSESYSIYLPYEVKDSVRGISYWRTALEVSPFHAALPIHFAS